MKKRMLRDALIAGLTLFAMFLGAGNIIFPPYVGVQAGTRWPLVAMGFLFTAAGLPMLGALTVAKLGGDPNRLCERAWPWMSKVLAALIIIMIGPLFAIRAQPPPPLSSAFSPSWTKARTPEPSSSSRRRRFSC